MRETTEPLARAAETIEIVANGRSIETREGTTVEGLLDELGLDPDLVVVERNGAILPRAGYATALAAGDELEIVHFVGGG